MTDPFEPPFRNHSPATPEGEAISRALPNAYYECAGCTQQGGERNCRPSDDIRLAPDETWLCEYCYDDAAYECGEDANWPVWADLPKLSAALTAQPVAWQPTEAMLIAARDWSEKKYGKPIGNDAAIGCWQAMFDAYPDSIAQAGRADVLAAKIEDLIAEFGSDPAAALTCISEWLQMRRHEIAHPATPAPVEAGLLDGLLATWAGLTESAEADLAEDIAEAETTGERPDLWAYKLEVGLDDARDLIGFLTSLRAQSAPVGGERINWRDDPEAIVEDDGPDPRTGVTW